MKFTGCACRSSSWSRNAAIRRSTTRTKTRITSGCGTRTASSATFPEVSIGRVIAVKRRCGLGKQIVAAAIDTAKEKLRADKITIEAQTYVKKLYEDFGFRQTSEEFLEDGIPHVQMQLDLTK